NSGAQHYSLLARDRDGARLTNLIYEGKVEDLYTDVKDHIKRSLIRDVSKAENYVRAEVEAARERGDNNLAEVEAAARSRLPKDSYFAKYFLSKDVLTRKFIKLLCVEALYGAKERGLEKEIRKLLMEETIPEIVKDEEEMKWRVKHRRTKKEEIDKERVKWLADRVLLAIYEA